MSAIVIFLISLTILILVGIVVGVLVWAFTSKSTPECTKDSDCGLGFICSDGACVKTTKTCRETRDCTPGEICLQGKCTFPPTLPEIKTKINPVITVKPTPIVRKPTVRPIIEEPVPVPKRKPNYSSESDDDEINSEGSEKDQPFDIISLSTEDSEDNTVVSTPYIENHGQFLCRTIDHDDKKSVIDVCSYSTYTIFLLEDGNVTLENIDNKEKNRVANNIPLQNIVSYNGYLFGLGTDKALYMLPSSYFSQSYWIWAPVRWAPMDIIHISTTQDSNYLWLQTSDKGYLYGENEKLISTENVIDKIRIFGSDAFHYLEYQDGTVTVYPSKQVYENVAGGALNYYNEVITIPWEQRNLYRKIVIVDWHPYFIGK